MRRAAPTVLDLSSLWAGPLCTHLLSVLGARVIKLESCTRPDGARDGEPRFFHRLNAGKDCVALDFSAPEVGARLLRLIDRCDIVVESSRPRALAQRGIDVDALLRARPELIWVSITGHGRGEPQGNWIGFGDDAAVAAGLCAPLHRAIGRTEFPGDAIADPLTGMRAAAWTMQRYHAGSGGLLDCSLRGSARLALERAQTLRGEEQLSEDFGRWWAGVRSGAHLSQYKPESGPEAHALGADNARWLD